MTSNVLRKAARYLFFGALIVAPWFYGGTTATSIVVIDCLLGAALLLWVIELIVNRRWPRIPTLLLAVILALLAIGIWMTLNARAIYDFDYIVFAPINNLVPRLPGAVDFAISSAWMFRVILLLVSILFVIDLVSDDAELLQLWYVIGFVVGSICLLGLLQKASGAEMIFWQPPPEVNKPVTTFFGTYFYHANAGAFLNLGLPLTTGLAVRALATPSSPVLLSTWLTAFVLNLGAIAANTSRMAQLIGVILFVPLCVLLAPKLVRGVSHVRLNMALTGIAALFILLYAVAQASHLDRPLKRWQTLGEQVPEDARWRADRIALSAIPEIGALGFGPGCFRAAFPIYNDRSSEAVPGIWNFLHQDYLQTLIEWGWVGSSLWAVLFFGGMAVAVFALRRQKLLRRGRKTEDLGQKTENSGQRSVPQKSEKLKTETLKSEKIPQILASQRFSSSAFPEAWLPRRRLLVPLVILALAGVAVHALVDFPLQIYSIQLYVATYLGICWGSARWNSARAGR